MRLCALFACLVVMGLISLPAFGVILADGGGDHWDYSSVRCQAGGEWPDYSEDSESGWWWKYTTVAGYFNWAAENAEARWFVLHSLLTIT